MQQLSNPSAPSRLLAHLILTHMVQTLRGDHQVELAVSIITRLDETLRGADLRAYEMTLESFHPDLLQAIHDRPHHAATGRLATLGLFVAMLKVVKPFGLQVTWLSDDASVVGAVQRALAYILTSSGLGISLCAVQGLHSFHLPIRQLEHASGQSRKSPFALSIDTTGRGCSHLLRLCVDRRSHLGHQNLRDPTCSCVCAGLHCWDGFPASSPGIAHRPAG